MGLSAMMDVVDLLVDCPDSAARVHEKLNAAREHVQRGNQVLQRLLDFARGIPQEVRAVRLDALIPDVVALCRAHPASRGIEVVTELPHDLPTVQVDPGQLHEVLMNLALNGMQAMGGSGTLTLAAERGEGCVRIRVTDTGCGIPPEDLERIFEPFFSHRQNGPPGTGIGLSASLRMVREMGGEITVESRVGVGSTFCVVFPLQEEANT
jgi:signal transduction histidine kinase